MKLKYTKRQSTPVKIGCCTVGGNNPIAIQSMTTTSTRDVEQSVAQVKRIAKSGGDIVRLTAQGIPEGEALCEIVASLRNDGYSTPIVADIHFRPEVAAVAAKYVDKVRVNPGNYNTTDGQFEKLMEQCRERGVAIRVGVNHGSLSKAAFEQYGDTPEGMVASAMEFLERAQRAEFDQIVVSMKSSNTRVMVAAYRLLTEAMDGANMSYPIHLGVTEAGNSIEGRIKSAVGIGALLADGIGDTIRVSLTEDPENEIAPAQLLVNHFAVREGEWEVAHPERYHPTTYTPRTQGIKPITHDEYSSEYQIIEAVSSNPTHEWRAAILNLENNNPVIIKRRYNITDSETLAICAAADMGQLLLDGLADGVWIDCQTVDSKTINDIELMILQASRVRFSRTEYIACPGCGRTLYNLQQTLETIKSRTSHLSNLKIGVMGCIVNGPGEMADADYGYVGAAAGKISLYRAGEVVAKNIPQELALDRLIEIIKDDNMWSEPKA